MQPTNSNSIAKWWWTGFAFCVIGAVVVAIVASRPGNDGPQAIDKTSAVGEGSPRSESLATTDSKSALKPTSNKSDATAKKEVLPPVTNKYASLSKGQVKGQDKDKDKSQTVSAKQPVKVASTFDEITEPAREIPSRVVPPLPAISPKLDHALSSIKAADAMKHVKVLTDPAFGGRPAGQAGARLASDYLAAQFREIGLAPGGQAGSYFQSFKIRIGYQIAGEMTIRRGKEEIVLPHSSNFMPIHLPSDSASVTAPCMLAGYGITSKTLDFDEYRKANVKGKAVLVFAGVPWSTDTDAWVRQADDRDFGSLAYKAKNAADRGAVMLLVVDNPTGWKLNVDADEQLRLPDRDFPVESTIPVVHLTRDAAIQLTGLSQPQLRLIATDITREQRSRSREQLGTEVTFKASISGSARIGRNVIGVLPGSDLRLRQEAVIIGAHYDHLGERPNGIYLGANDNAAGVAAVLEAAEAFRSLPAKPKRSIIFIAFAAEEIGKLGSSHYVNRPTMPIERTVAMINFDMIARNEPNHLYAVGTRSSRELHIIHQQVNQYVGLELEHPSRYRLGLSDHTAFYRKNVPIMYLFGGRHDGYHTPADTMDKLVPEKIERASKLAFLTARAIADRPGRLTFDGYFAE